MFMVQNNPCNFETEPKSSHECNIAQHSIWKWFVVVTTNILDELSIRFGSATKVQKRTAIQVLSKAGISKESISRAINVNPKTVTKWRQREGNSDMPRSGAPSVLSVEAKEHITEQCRDKWNISTRKLQKILASDAADTASMSPSRSTISRYIRSADWGKTAYKILTRPMLSQKNVRDRFRFCSELMALGYCERTNQGDLLRNNFLFTDESFIELYPKPNSQNMRIRPSNPEQRASASIPKHGL
jgi:transposase-like protein